MIDNKTLSEHYKHWISCEDDRRCVPCETMHGKIYEISVKTKHPPLHLFCRCKIVKMSTRQAGTATSDGTRGADWCLKRHGCLPNYYISKETAARLGWENQKGNLSSIAPGRMIGGDIYYNRDGHLPSAIERIWYEADINYRSGYRTPERILYSSDGLIFVTYDHYHTFIEVV